MKPPTSLKEVQQFIGVVNYYCNMWSRCSHMIAPLTEIPSNKVKFKWTKIKQDDFDEIKWIVACNNLLTFTDLNEEFKIHTNVSNFQLVAVISQKGKTIDFYSRRLTDYQKRYTVTEKELLIIVESLKKFITILLCQRLIIYTDHKKSHVII